MLNRIWRNPISVWLMRAFKAILLERKHKNKNLKVGYMCYLRDCIFGNYNNIGDNVELTDVSIGDYTYIAPGAIIKNATLGNFCSIGPEIFIGLGKHPAKKFVSTHPLFFSTRGQVNKIVCDKVYFEEFAPVSIGNDVWIGARAIIMDGVSIGNGAIIGAGAIVTKDIPPFAIVGGAPAKLIKYRFEPSEIEILESTKWWNLDFRILEKNYHSLHDIKKFVNEVENGVFSPSKTTN